MKRFLILVGGELHETASLKRRLSEGAFEEIVAGDGGLEWAKKLSLCPTRMVGDFDSVDKDVLAYFRQQGIPERVFPTHKDDTDSELALRVVMEKAEAGDEILIAGGLGGRFDHTLANILLLLRPLSAGMRAEITDGLNFARIVTGPFTETIPYVEDLQYLSLIPLSETIEGVSMAGVEYPLQNASVPRGVTLCVSNEIHPPSATVSIKRGMAVLIRAANQPHPGAGSGA